MNVATVVHPSTQYITATSALLRPQIDWSGWQMAVVDISAVTDCFNNQLVGFPIPGDDGSVVASAELVV